MMPIVNSPHIARYGLFAGITGVFLAGVALGQSVSARQTGVIANEIMRATQSVVGEPIVYPTATPAEITTQIVTLAPGAATPWHRHPMPTFGYILDGEIEVDYGARGRKTFRKGDALMEAMAHIHRGHNVSQRPVRILVVSIGAKGQPLAVKSKN